MNISGLLNEIWYGIKILDNNQRIKVSYGASRNETLQKSINKIKESFILLSEGAKKIESGHNLIKKHKIKSDLRNLLKIVKSKSENDEKLAMVIGANIRKLMVKHNIEYVTIKNEQNPKKKAMDKQEKKSGSVITSETPEQKRAREIAYQKDLEKQHSYEEKLAEDKLENKEFYDGLKERIELAKKLALKKKSEKGVKCDGPVQLFDTAEVRRLAEEQLRKKEEDEINKELAERAQIKDLLEDIRLEGAIKEEVISESKAKEETKFEDMPKRSLSIFEEMIIKSDIKRSKRNLETTGEKRKLPWYATTSVAGALAISAISGGVALFNHNSEKVGSLSLDDTKYIDSVDPELSANEQSNKATNVIQGSDSSTHKTAVTEISGNSSTTTTKNEQKDDTIEPIVFDVGDKVSVSDGLVYTSTCLGKGNKNKIGSVSWRPATDYYVDQVAFCYEGKVLGIMKKGDTDVKQVLDDYASKYKIDVSEIDTSVLLSLTPGSGDTGWASISIEELEQNKSKTDENKKDTENIKTKKDIKLDLDR